MEINSLLQTVVDKRASDLMIIANTPPVLRINDAISYLSSAVLSESESKALIYGLLSPKQIETFEKEKELDCSYQLKDFTRFRVNVHYQKGTVAASLRLIPSQIPSMEELKLPKVVADFANIERGLILVTGPTGSGKTTTQACMVDMIGDDALSVVRSIENPKAPVRTVIAGIVDKVHIG